MAILKVTIFGFNWRRYQKSRFLVFWNWAASEYENEQMTTKFEKKENWDGALFCQEIIGRMGNWGKNFFFCNFVSPEAKGWCPKGKSIEFGFPNEECVFLKENTLEWGKPNSMDFPEGHQPFAEGETNLTKKNFFFPKFIILPMISRQNKTPVSILLKLKSLRHLFVFILRTCPVSVYFVTWRSWFFFLFAEF